MGVAASAFMLRVIEVCWGYGGVHDIVGLCVCTLFSCEVYWGCGWGLLWYSVRGVLMRQPALWAERGRYGEVCSSRVAFLCLCWGICVLYVVGLIDFDYICVSAGG